TPNANFHGSDSFTYRSNDGSLDSAPATVSITVNPANDAPSADDQIKTTAEDTAVAITLTGSDLDGDPISFAVASGPGNGSLSGTAPNLTYTPNANFHGSDSFTYRSNDGSLNSALATVSITVESVNDAPVADGQNKITAEETAVAITLTGSDVDGDAISFTVVTDPGNGSLSGTAPNLTYTPNANFHGSDSFTYRSNDGSLDSAPATVSITVNAANDAPTANDQSKTTAEDTAVAITLTGSDLDGDPISFTVVSGPGNGSLSGTAPNLTYTPNANFHGSDSFTYIASDGMLDSAPATVSITVESVNDAPTANDQSKTTAEETAVAITLTASDVDGDPISFTVVTGPGNGSLSGTAPSLTYTPNVNFHGSDSFTYIANDGLLDSAPATVSIAVNAANGAPTADDQSKTTAEDTAVAITLTGSDPGGDPISFTVVTGPGNGSLSGAAPNLTYTPNANFHGSDSFTYIASDGMLDSAPATVSITVESVNDAPVADNKNKAIDEDTAVAIILTASDVDGDPISFTVVTDPGNGSLRGTAPYLTYTPNLTYIPNAGYHGSDSFTYIANDGLLDSAPATVNITINSTNEAPVADAGPDQTALVTSTVVLDGSGSSDANGDALSYSWSLISPTGSIAALSSPGVIDPSFSVDLPGTYIAHLIVHDGTVDSLADAVSITVSDANNSPEITSIAITTATENVLYRYTLVATDADGDSLTYKDASPGLPAWIGFNIDTGELSGIPGEDDIGSFTVVLQVSDGIADPVEQEFIINVGEDGPPIVIAPADIEIESQGATTS
ncbi:MAG: tandem-95 repeat protein, partial [bacterium]|nr:tandem-95 repeat protein [bacterium]